MKCLHSMLIIMIVYYFTKKAMKRHDNHDIILSWLKRLTIFFLIMNIIFFTYSQMLKVDNIQTNNKSSTDNDTNIYTLDMKSRCKNPFCLINESLMFCVLVFFLFGIYDLKKRTHKELKEQLLTYG